eukprot:CAMPEP_0119280052 /NCGR_PEP_ID=MMETSP1329-20130426/21992_1 /TAXON_ID=114041 /ORGANISM="Genus nov. species nov., Strain RCC1024" /LENGTH=39 /DNA_ID= /DNA_START= /DNA_END= /DNA_ORIENTATION=
MLETVMGGAGRAAPSEFGAGSVSGAAPASGDPNAAFGGL